MATKIKLVGTVANISADKTFAFITPDGGNSDDVFFGEKAWSHAGQTTPKRGDRVSFNAVMGQRGYRANDVERVNV